MGFFGKCSLINKHSLCAFVFTTLFWRKHLSLLAFDHLLNHFKRLVKCLSLNRFILRKLSWISHKTSHNVPFYMNRKHFHHNYLLMTEELREMIKDYVEMTFYGWLLRAEKVDFYVYSLMVLRKKSLLSKSIAAFISDMAVEHCRNTIAKANSQAFRKDQPWTLYSSLNSSLKAEKVIIS